jgi:cation diffusion facilitator CzcD-associated flavoprotein CzcO
VVGAGPAGLAASAALSAGGVEHVVLERGRPGESWRTQRWDSFRLNTPGWMNRLLGEQARVERLAPAGRRRRGPGPLVSRRIPASRYRPLPVS